MRTLKEPTNRIGRNGPRKWRTGWHHSEITKKKLSELQKGKHPSEETLKKMSDSQRGRRHSEETKQKIREANMGEKNPMYGRCGDKHPGFGKPRSEEVRKKVKEHHADLSGKKSVWYGRHHTEESKIRISKAHKGLHSGEKNPIFGKYGPMAPGWLGGKSFEPYTFDFNKRFKKNIRKRDGCCMVCNVSFEDLHLLKRKIHVHHIDYNKRNSFLQNCITLCNPCHTKTNHNRNHWQKFFQSLLKERYCYEYTEDQKIILDFTKIMED